MPNLWPVWLCLGGGGLICVLLQRMARINAGKTIASPSLAGDALAFLVGIQSACLFLLLTGRPLTTILIVLGLFGLLLVINRVKERVLHEPLVLADAWLLPQVWKYPEMYLPFMPMRLIGIGAAFLAVCLGVLLYAEPVVGRGQPGTFLFLLLGATVPVFLVWALRHNRLPESVGRRLLGLLPVSHDAAADAARNGALAAALMHPVLAGALSRQAPDYLADPEHRPASSRWPEHFERFLDDVIGSPIENCPHVVIVQAESFCDIREHVEEAQKKGLENLLPNWDRLKAAHRTLPTPESAYGAYTMRTEFSMLTGLGMESLGPFGFNPYLLAAQRPLWSLARLFTSKGYATFCIHPYHKGFFRRDKVMPNLGFQHFWGLEELRHLPKFGPYVSDAALGHTIASLVAESSQPVFCFAITMENHGPWHPDRLADEDDFNGTGNPSLRHYLRHLRNLDSMLGILQRAVDPTGCWVYGDHLPAFI